MAASRTSSDSVHRPDDDARPTASSEQVSCASSLNNCRSRQLNLSSSNPGSLRTLHQGRNCERVPCSRGLLLKRTPVRHRQVPAHRLCGLVTAPAENDRRPVNLMEAPSRCSHRSRLTECTKSDERSPPRKGRIEHRLPSCAKMLERTLVPCRLPC